jgi:hypothetical protein
MTISGMIVFNHRAKYSTTAVWNEWFTVHQLRRHNVVPVENVVSVRWEKSGVSWIKCNVDATLVAGSSVTSTSLYFRSTDGQFIADLTQWRQPVYFVVEDKA